VKEDIDTAENICQFGLNWNNVQDLVSQGVPVTTGFSDSSKQNEAPLMT
jgi:hypothetical protein